MSQFRQYLKKAIENVISHGDTDIFPFPVENILFNDNKTAVLNLLEKLHKNFDEYITNYPLLHERSLQAVGYYGFRYGTQLDPLWNTYLLALVLSIADDMESARVPLTRKKIFSYRYSFDKEKSSMFDKGSNWSAFNERATELAQKNKVILKCDISNFYPSIYHHRLENALKKASSNTCLLYTSDAADEGLGVDLGGRRIIK